MLELTGIVRDVYVSIAILQNSGCETAELLLVDRNPK